MTPLEAHNWLSNTPGADSSLIGQLITDQQGITSTFPGTPERAAAEQRLDATLQEVQADRARVGAENAATLAAANGPAMDTQAGAGTCDCAAAEPCCVTEVKFGCSHTDDRMILPLADPNAEPLMTLVADKGPNPGKDTLKVNVTTSGPTGTCIMPKSQPLLTVSGQGIHFSESGTSMTLDLEFSDNADLGSTDIEKFVNATGRVIFGDMEDIGQELAFSLGSCSGRCDFDAKLLLFPKIEWTSSNFGYDIRGTYFTNGNFVPSIKFDGSIGGDFCGTSWSVGASGSHKADPQGHSKSVIPFLDRALERMTRMTSGGASQGNSTYSSIQVRHAVALGDSKFSIAEHPDDHSNVGIDGKIELGFNPLFGITATLDIIDALLTAANSVAPGLAEALRKARQAAATGIGDRDGPLHLRAHAAVTLSVNGDIGQAGVVLTRGPGDEHWQGSGQVGGSVGITVAAVIQADGKMYIVSGTFAARAQARSSIEATLKTLTRSEQEASNGKKFNTEIKWDGVRVSYSMEVQATFLGIINTGTKTESGSITIFEPVDLYNSNF